MSNVPTSGYFYWPAETPVETALRIWHRFFSQPPERIYTGEGRIYLGPFPDEEEQEGNGNEN